MKVYCFAYFLILVLFASLKVNCIMGANQKIIGFDNVDFEHIDLIQEEASTTNTLKLKVRNSKKPSRKITDNE
jgi:hypothetical protein